MNRTFLILSACLMLAACNSGGDAPVETPDVLVHPEWSQSAVIYEMNVRQHSADGTLNTAMADLARLNQLGVNIVWLMPVHPIGEVNRKGGENQDNDPAAAARHSKPLQRPGLHRTQPGLRHVGGLRCLRVQGARL